MGFIITVLIFGIMLFGVYKIPGKLVLGNEYSTVKREINLQYAKIVLALAATLLFVVNSFFVIVAPGQAKVGVLFGSIDGKPLLSGLHFRNPLVDFTDFDLRRQSLDFNSSGDAATHEDDVFAMSSNELPMTIDSTFGYQYNAKWLPWIMTNLGDVRGDLLLPASRSAVRSSAAKFAANDAAVAKRQDFETSLQGEFEAAVIEGLVGQGLTQAEAEQVFIFLPVQLRKVLPPQKILDVKTSEEAADRQVGVEKKLTAAMEERANRLTQEGAGYANAIKELPDGVPVDQVTRFIEALAMKEAVANDKVSVIVMNGGTTAISVK